MTLQRANPTPPGRYWIDVFGANRDTFNVWLADNAGSVVRETSESFDSSPPRDFNIVRVLKPIQFDQKTFGFFTLADKSVTSADDTAQKPDLPKDPLDSLDNTLSHIGAIAGVGLGILTLALVVQVISNHRKQ